MKTSPISARRVARDLALTAFVAGTAGLAHAQSVQVQPGLWASSTVTVINGKNLPTILDIKGALTPQQRSNIVSTMSRLGLPAGGSPQLYCQQGSTYAMPRDTGVEGCEVTASPGGAAEGTITTRCTSATTQVNGQGRYQVVDGKSASVQSKLEGTHQGAPIKLEQTYVAKWIASDCSKPPQGMDPSLFKLSPPSR